MLHVVIAIFLTTLLPADTRLDVSPLTPPRIVSDALIVGRAACPTVTWLLNDATQLISVDSSAAVAARAVRGFAAGERPWGLACLPDGTLRTMATPRSLVSIDPSGMTHERIAVPLPRTALFAAGDRLLFQSSPIAVGAAALASSPPRQPMAARPWPGLIVRGASRREDEITRNLVLCGVPSGREVPCWFEPDAQISISDGQTVRVVAVTALYDGPIARSAPLQDVALAPGRVWLLLTGGRDGDRPSGRRLVAVSERGGDRWSADLNPPARLILSATAERCLLLATDGSIVSAVVTR